MYICMCVYVRVHFMKGLGSNSMLRLCMCVCVRIWGLLRACHTVFMYMCVCVHVWGFLGGMPCRVYVRLYHAGFQMPCHAACCTWVHVCMCVCVCVSWIFSQKPRHISMHVSAMCVFVSGTGNDDDFWELESDDILYRGMWVNVYGCDSHRTVNASSKFDRQQVVFAWMCTDVT